MLEWLATSILFTPNGVSLESSDSWAIPYVEPVKGERIALRQGELSKAVTGLKADVQVLPWMPRLAKVVVTVSLRNPGQAWLRWARVDLEVTDQARIGKPLYTSVLFSAVKPGETASRSNDRLWIRMLPGEFGRVQYKAKAQLAGAFRIEPPKPPGR